MVDVVEMEVEDVVEVLDVMKVMDMVEVVAEDETVELAVRKK